MISFEISLAEDTAPEVIEWFEFMNNQCILSKEVIKLVSESIANQTAAASYAADNFTTMNSIDDPMVNLFNWKDSSSTLFVNENKQKKKMLMV